MNNNVATRKQNHSSISIVTGQKSHQLITKISAPSKAVLLCKLLPFRNKASRINRISTTTHENQWQQNVPRANQHRIEAEITVLSHG